MLRDYSKQLRPIVEYADIALAALVFGGLASLPLFDLQMIEIPDRLAAGDDVPAQAALQASRAAVGLLGLGLTATLTWPVLLRQLGMYSQSEYRKLSMLIPRIALASAIATALQLLFATLLRVPAPLSFLLVCGTAQGTAIAGGRLLMSVTRHWLHPHARLTRNVIIVGSGPRAAYVHKVIEDDADSRIRVLGFVDAGPPPGGQCVPAEQVFKFSDMRGLIADQVVDEVVIACPRAMLGSIVDVVDACAAAGVPITLLSDLFGDYLPAPETARFGTLPALTFAQVHHHPGLLILKRLMDILGSVALLVASGPILLFCAAAIRLSSKGPVFYEQVRCGLNGRHFVMYKLRTMYIDADERKEELRHLNEMDGPVFKIERDPRVTPLGTILRRASLDELPQLWNVLKGDMSLVGPRPPVPLEVAEYQTFQRRRLSMRPGLTCIWQISGRNQIGFEDWVRLDLEYIDTWSLRGDVKILFKTLPAVISGSGAS